MAVLDSALSFVPQWGWSREALTMGAQTAGLSGVAHGMFPRGGIELVNHFSEINNNSLARYLKSKSMVEGRSSDVHSFLEDALEYRLRLTVPYVEKWPQAMALMALPPNVPDSLSLLFVLVDDVWYYAGDRSADFSWYTKRAGLAVVYSAAELVLVQDRSEDLKETTAFLKHQLQNLETARERLRMANDAFQELPNFFHFSLQIARNVLGLRSSN